MQLSFWETNHFVAESDLIVIGSGIVGINAALSYKKLNPDGKVIILERGILPSGASTKNAGFACIGSISELADDLTKTNPKNVWETVQLRYRGLKKLRELIGDVNMDYLHFGGFEVFDNKNEFEKCAELIDEYNYFMRDITGISQTFKVNNSKINDSGIKGFNYCIENTAEGQINTGLMMRRLLKKAHEADVLILNAIRVNNVVDNGNLVNIHCENGFELSAKKVIVATNGFAGELLQLPDVLPARAQVLITNKIKGLKLQGGFHYQSGYYYFRNINERILFGGGRNLDLKGETTAEFGLTSQIQNSLEHILSNNILPTIDFKIEQRWSGIMGVGSEKKPIIKSISENVVCAVRMGGMGVAIGTLVGEMAVNELLN